MSMRRWLLLLILFAVSAAWGEELPFPPPEFEAPHPFPETTQPPARSLLAEYIDVFILVAALTLSAWFVLRLRSRTGVVGLGIFSLLYFGFWRQGCVCAIGSIQNVTLALFDTSYAVPLTVIAFFFAPLLAALLFGRVFCAAVCPHGALQDLVLLKPVTVPLWIEAPLRTFTYAWLGLAVLFAATGAGFLICEYDPFIAIFRMTGGAGMVSLGIAFLLLGLFVGRPYCRYMCPYGVLLGLAGAVSKYRVNITPDTCIQCRLCESSCPYASIHPASVPDHGDALTAPPRLWIPALVALAVLVISVPLGGWMGYALARHHGAVERAAALQARDGAETMSARQQDILDAQRAGSLDAQAQFAEATATQRRFRIGGFLFGGWMGLVVGIRLLLYSLRKRRPDHEADPITCIACARCYMACPKEHERLGLVVPDVVEGAAV